jgi:hypothetical protein
MGKRKKERAREKVKGKGKDLSWPRKKKTIETSSLQTFTRSNGSQAKSDGMA